ncbi:MAG: cysteine hydrolase [Chloroflexi bacterium]|nr:cysteine hydrolase [Chloroflexota bacterium]
MANAVLVIDMVRGFVEEGHALSFPEAGRIVPAVAQLLEAELAKGSTILYLCDNHDPNDLEFRMFPRHCVVGTTETEIVPELQGYRGEYIPKRRFSAFYGTRLGERLAQLKPDQVVVTGVCTDICVLHTVGDARDRDYEVVVPANCVATFDQEAHRFALKHMEKVLGAKVVGAEVVAQQ